MQLVIVLMSLLVAGPVQATVFWDDEMESGNTGYTLPSGGMSYDTSIKYSGNGSTRYNFDALCYPDSSAQANCGGFMDRSFTATGTLFRRFYMRLSTGFTVSDVFTKLMRSDTYGIVSNWWTLGCCGSRTLEVHDQNVPVGDTTVQYTSWQAGDATWYCVETEETLNTPGVANGVARAWVDGVQVLNVTNIPYRAAGDTSLFNNNRLYRQTGLGSIWFDRVAVGDTRIGCIGAAPPADTTPPTQVTGLSVTPASSSSTSLTWTAASDAGGIGVYTVRRCQGTGCTGFVNITQTASLVYTDTGLSASTTYRYQVAAQDLAGNIGAYSSAVDVTTLANTPQPIAFTSATLSPDNETANTVTFNVTVPPGNNLVMLACLAARDSIASDLSATAVTFNGMPLTKIRADDANWGGTAHARIEQWRLIDPLVGTYSFNTQWANVIPSEYAVVGVSVYSDVDQLTPIEASAGASGNSTTPSVSVTSLTDLASPVDCVLARDDAGPTVGAGQTVRIRNKFGVTEATNDWMGSSSVLGKTPAGAETMDWTQSSSDWIINAVVLKPVTVTVPPTITGLAVDATGATLTFGSTTPTTIRVQTYSTLAAISDTVEPIASFPSGRYTHTWPQSSQSVCFFPRDSAGIENTDPTAYQCTTLAGVVVQDTTPPVLSAGAPTTALAAGTTSTTESVATNEPAQCRRSLTDQAYSAMTNQMTTLNGLAHTWAATGLTNGTTYTVYVRCTDQYDSSVALPNNVSSSSYTFSYSVASSGGDTTPPSTVSGTACSAYSASQIACTFGAATDNTAVTGYEGHLCPDAACTTSSLINPTWSTATSQTISGLTANTTYYIAVKAFDAAGNRSASLSNIVTVTTLATADLDPPSQVVGVTLVSRTYNALAVSHTAATDNVHVKQYNWEICKGAGCTNFSPVGTSTTTTFSVNGLLANTVYRLRAVAVDDTGNTSTSYSTPLDVTTNPLPRSLRQGICPCRS